MSYIQYTLYSLCPMEQFSNELSFFSSDLWEFLWNITFRNPIFLPIAVQPGNHRYQGELRSQGWNINHIQRRSRSHVENNGDLLEFQHRFKDIRN